MKFKHLYLGVAAVALASCSTQQKNAKMNYPETKK